MEASVLKPKTWNQLKEQYGIQDRRLSENSVEYLLFILSGTGDAREQASALEEIRRTALEFVKSLTEDFIWQRGEFSLALESGKGLIYLRGVTDYGDSIEDEWLIVYVLRELSKKIPGLWVHAFDSDGEFLLIEAASVVPRWLSPSSDSNRTWIHNGKILIIPTEQDSGDSPHGLSLAEAISRISTTGTSLIHSSLIEAEAFYRLEKYPEQIKLAMHHSVVTIPRKLAYILHELPRLVAPAIEEIYAQDPTALKHLISTKGEWTFPPEDFVTLSVRFTKVLYAQLRSQRFEDPPLWRNVLSRESFPASEMEASSKRGPRLEMGMKLTCGFEMLAYKSSKSNNRVVREMSILLDDLNEDGDGSLPTDDDIKSWRYNRREDDDSWMDIDFDQFDKELRGEGAQTSGEAGPGTGLGNANTEADLKKMVSRFEKFLNDEGAGLEGAEFEEGDSESGSVASSDSEEEDKEVSFDEAEFSRMMRELMCLPPEAGESGEMDTSPSTQPTTDDKDEDEDDEDEDDEEVRQMMKQMESELRGHGALNLGADPTSGKALKGKDVSRGQSPGTIPDVGDEGSDGEVDVNYNLAKNILESFKGQAGLAGPAGNILAMLGIQLPRDEGGDGDDSDNDK